MFAGKLFPKLHQVSWLTLIVVGHILLTFPSLRPSPLPLFRPFIVFFFAYQHDPGEFGLKLTKAIVSLVNHCYVLLGALKKKLSSR